MFGDDIIKKLVAHNLISGPMTLRRDSTLLLCTLTIRNEEAAITLYDTLYDRVAEAMEYCTSAG